MTVPVAILLGIIEGLTEYLPVSSTGHLILAAHFLGQDAGAFEIVIQLGAILAVLVHYRALWRERTLGLFTRDPRSLALFKALIVAFVPTAVAGLLLRHTIKKFLFGSTPVAIALVLGGVVMIVLERALRGRAVADGLEHVTPKRALYIGLGQCFALIPGTSRSMSTILAGQLAGLSTATAAEFSFLLGLPTLGAATLYEGYKSRHELMSQVGPLNMAVGIGVSFVVAWAVIAAFLRYLKTRGLEPFGWYRIVLGVIVLWVVAR